MCLHILELTAAVDFEAQQNAASVHAHTPSAAGKCTSESPIHTVFAQQTTSILFTILLPGLCHEPMHESFVRVPKCGALFKAGYEIKQQLLLSFRVEVNVGHSTRARV